MQQRITQAEIDQATAAVEAADGNQSAAARALGIPRETLRGRLARAACSETDATLDAKLQTHRDKAAEDLQRARDARGLVLPVKIKGKKPKTFARLIFSDTHGSHVDSDAINAMLGDLAHIDVREIVMLGDHLECGGFLAQHHALGYISQIDEANPEEDIAATRDLLDALQSRCPGAAIHYMEGNHEHRVERWCVDSAGGNRASAEYLLRCHGPEASLSLAARGVHYYRIGERHCGLSERGILKLGRSYFTHGHLTRKHAASGMVDRFAACVFYGHTHRADYFPTRMVATGLVAAWCPGCLRTLQPCWKHNDPTTWTHGYILQLVNDDTGDFHAIPVPIFNGHSYLANLLEVIG